MVDGAKLRSLREAANMTQEEVADRAGVTIKAISFFENSLRNPSVEVLKHIADTLGVKVDDLLRKPDEQEDSA